MTLAMSSRGVGLRSLVALVALAIVSKALAQVSSLPDFKNPVRSATEDKVASLPGLNYKLGFNQYSGYLEADEEKPTNRFWHYWFVESQSDPANDPLVLWLNGGPGCSSLLGLLTELGPFSVGANGELSNNTYAWNQHANVIFLESPAGVGYSYSVNGDSVADDDSTAKQNHFALRSFFRKFPQFQGRPLYLTGESYGGVYLPTLAVLVDEDSSMNLKGVAIGNGYLDANKLAESLVYFVYHHGLIGESTWKGLSEHCCDGKPPARGDCKIVDSRKSVECDTYLNQVVNSVLESGLNPYNLYDRCSSTSTSQLKGLQQSSRETFDKSLLVHAFNASSSILTSKRLQRSREFKVRLGEDPPCTDEHVTVNYLNDKEVRAALHIPEQVKQFQTCFDGIKYTMIYPGRQGGLAPQINKLLASNRKITLLVYNGDIDLMCNFLGDEWFVDDLGRKVLVDYAPWHLNGQIAGYVKHYEGITFMTIRGSGHMVPTDRSAEAYQMFDVFLNGHGSKQ